MAVGSAFRNPNNGPLFPPGSRSLSRFADGDRNRNSANSAFFSSTTRGSVDAANQRDSVTPAEMLFG
jgi:hypothetical protein